MIIETMEQLWRLVESRDDLEYDTLCEGGWIDMNQLVFNQSGKETLVMVKNGRIRTKPLYVDVKIRLNAQGLVVDTEGLYCLPDDRVVVREIVERITLDD